MEGFVVRRIRYAKTSVHALGRRFGSRSRAPERCRIHSLGGVVSDEDVAKLKAAQDFLLRVRNELHFSAGKHRDQLTFDEQEKVSQALGYHGEGSLKAVEVFMREYYLHAS